MAWIDAGILKKETRKFKKELKKQNLPMTEVQRAALHERIVHLTALRMAQEERDRLLNPSSTEIKAAREAAGLTQAEAAYLIHCSSNTWQKWECGERKMRPAYWELFQLKVKSLKPSTPV